MAKITVNQAMVLMNSGQIFERVKKQNHPEKRRTETNEFRVNRNNIRYVKEGGAIC